MKIYKQTNFSNGTDIVMTDSEERCKRFDSYEN